MKDNTGAKTMQTSYRMEWVLIGKDYVYPILGRIDLPELEDCYLKMRNEWHFHGFILGNLPRVWAYTIKDKHGRTIEAESLVDGVWHVQPELKEDLVLSARLEETPRHW